MVYPENWLPATTVAAPMTINLTNLPGMSYPLVFEMQKLLQDLLKMHKTVKINDEFAWGEQYLVNCRCCDGQMRHIWQPGDEDYKCGFWQRAEKLGLTDGL